MKRIAQAIGLALLLAAAIVTGAVAQRAATLSPLSPFLVDIRQTVPITFTFTVDDKAIIVPAAVDVALTIQVHADGSYSPTMQVGKANAPVVAVEPLSPTPQPSAQNTDANGLPYTTDVVDGLVLEQVNSPGLLGLFAVAGVIRNNTANDLGMFDVNIVITTFDDAGKLLAVSPGWLSAGTLRADGVSPFTVNTTQDAEDVASYTVQISTN